MSTSEAAPMMMTEGVITFLEQLANSNARTEPIRSPFHSTHTPPMTIRLYCERILKYSKCSPEAFVVGMMLLCKFSFFTRYSVSVFNVHRMLITSTLIAAKMRDDEYYANTYYARIGGINVEELNALELHFLSTLCWDIWIGEDEFEKATAMLLTVVEAMEAARTDRTSADLALQVWSNWLSSFEQETHSRHKRISDTLADDIRQEAARTTTTPKSMYGSRPPVAQRTTPTSNSSAAQGRPGFPSAPSQQSVGYCESSASLDAIAVSAKGSMETGATDSTNGSGSLGPDGHSAEHSPCEGGPAAQSLPQSETKSSLWANAVRNSTTRSASKSDDATEVNTPSTPTNQTESNYSSQQVTPTRTMTKQRFQSARSTPTVKRQTSVYNDPSVLRQGAFQQPAPAWAAPAVVENTTVASAPANAPQSGRGRGEGKKRPKPDHYVDYR